MKPVTPIFPGRHTSHVIFAKDQPQYLPLPAHRDADGRVTSRWSLSWKERLIVLFTGHIWHRQLTFNFPLQPVMLLATAPKAE